MLATADGHGTNEIMRRTRTSKPCVWRWQQRYVAEGVEGLLRGKTRPAGTPPWPEAVRRKVIAKAAGERPPNATHWSVRTTAAEVGMRHTSMQRIWAEAGLKPHLVKRFKISNDPQLEEKVAAVVGLYLDPADRALVLCVDEESEVQALDRTQIGLPLKLGRAATTTDDCKRHSTKTPVRDARCAKRSCPRQIPAAPSCQGVHSLLAQDRPDREGGAQPSTTTSRTRRPRSRRGCQTSPLPLPLHARREPRGLTSSSHSSPRSPRSALGAARSRA